MENLFTSIFILLLIFAWLVLSFLPWLVKSLFRVGHAGYRSLFFCLLFGVLAGVVVLLLISTTSGLGWSFLGAVLVSSIALLSPMFLQKLKINN
tara:strand:- start:1674 stop:1955 length:282 start_codon:yes stop_codon:yes gene_type:complete